MNKLITQAAYARQRGVSKQRINTLVQTGVIKLKDGKIDPEAADKAIADYTDPARAGKNAPAAPDFQVARAAKEFYLAKLRRLEYEHKSGKLVDADEVKAQAFRTGRTVRDSLLNLPDRLAPVLAAETDANQIHEIMNREIRQALEALAG